MAITRRSFDALLLWLVDGLALAGAWWVSLAPIADMLKGGEWSGMMAIFFTAILAPAVGIWMQIRVAPILIQLASNRAWRQELALTLLPAQEYLVPKLRRAVLCSVLPVTPCLGVAAAGSLKGAVGFGIAIIALLYTSTILSVSIAGLADGFLRMCRARKVSALTALVPVMWAFACPLAAVIVVLGPGRLIGERSFSAFTYALIFTVVFVTLIAGLLIFALIRWRQAVRAFYELD